VAQAVAHVINITTTQGIAQGITLRGTNAELHARNERRATHRRTRGSARSTARPLRCDRTRVAQRCRYPGAETPDNLVSIHHHLDSGPSSAAGAVGHTDAA
jgi:hypothetical protein